MLYQEREDKFTYSGKFIIYWGEVEVSEQVNKINQFVLSQRSLN